MDEDFVTLSKRDIINMLIEIQCDAMNSFGKLDKLEHPSLHKFLDESLAELEKNKERD